MSAKSIPVMALSAGERGLLNISGSGLTGQLAAWNYFQLSLRETTEATFIGFRMWAQAVSQAGTTDFNVVRQAMF
jgi:urea transport system substrate-binding protein